MTLLYGKINSEKQLEQCEQSYLPPTQIGILKVMTDWAKLLHLPYKNMADPRDVLTAVKAHAASFFRFHRSRLTFYFLLHCQTLDEMKLELKPIKIDRRLTGSSFIDEPLQQVCLFFV